MDLLSREGRSLLFKLSALETDNEASQLRLDQEETDDDTSHGCELRLSLLCVGVASEQLEQQNSDYCPETAADCAQDYNRHALTSHRHVA